MSFSAIFPNAHIMRAICVGAKSHALGCIHAAVKLLINSGEARKFLSAPPRDAHARIVIETSSRVLHHTTAIIHQ